MVRRVWTQNPARSVELYQRAVDAGKEYAMVNLARLLSKGAKGVARDRACAIQLYSHVIEQEADAGQIYRAQKDMEALGSTKLFRWKKPR